MSQERPVALVDPAPRTLAEIFRPEELNELEAHVDLLPRGGRPTAREIEEILPRASLVIGQTSLDTARLRSAPKLRAVFNVEGNFLPNVDYAECFARGVHVLSITPVFCLPVAELGLAMALDLARGMTEAHQAFREGRERYGLESTREGFLLTGQPVSIIGLGGLGRALLALLAPFRCRVRVFDPWLPERAIRALGCEPVDLDTALAGSRVVFVTASVTTENQGFLGERELDRMARGTLFILLSRAGVVDFDALTAAATSGHLRVATDVFPVEPLPPDHPIRRAPNVLLSAHRAGAMEQALKEIGTLVLSDVKQILRGLPPSACLRAERETVTRLRSAPVAKT